MKLKILTILITITAIYLILSYEKPKSYHAGFMYWSSPTILREHWDLALTGRVLSIEKDEHLSGSIGVDEVLYQDRYDVIGKQELKAFNSNVVNISGGFSGYDDIKNNKEKR